MNVGSNVKGPGGSGRAPGRDQKEHPVSIDAIGVSVENLRHRIRQANAYGGVALDRAIPQLLEDAVILIGGLVEHIQDNPPSGRS